MRAYRATADKQGRVTLSRCAVPKKKRKNTGERMLNTRNRISRKQKRARRTLFMKLVLGSGVSWAQARTFIRERTKRGKTDWTKLTPEQVRPWL